MLPRFLFTLLPLAVVYSGIPAVAQTQAVSANDFDHVIKPFVQQNCAGCHNDKLRTAGLILTKYRDIPGLIQDREVWEKVIRRVRNGEMPPRGLPKPSPEAIATVTNWIEEQFAIADRAPADPGHLTAHRLNRVEYDNTIRDLLGMNLKVSAEFPADDSGYGFDNIGDALSVSPVLLEKYLNAATKIANRAIPPDTLPKATRVRFSPERGAAEDGLALEHRYEFPAEGNYEWKVSVGGRKQAFRIHLFEDGKEVKVADVLIEHDKPRAYEVKLHETYGPHVLSAQLEPRAASPEEQAVAQDLAAKEQADFDEAVAEHPENAKQLALQRTVDNPPTYIDSSELRGPYQPVAPPMPAGYGRIFICGHAPGHHTAECTRRAIEHLMPLAYRRPVMPDEVDRVVRLVQSAQKDGMTIEQSMRIGLEAMLVSPNFLFRIERDPQPNDASAIHPISDYELASRLSYFLWSSMPDQTLFDLAAKGQLRDSAVLSVQLKRMLKDPKSDALVENFAGQWLELRNLDSIRPDPDEFPQFSNSLRHAMYTESEMFVQSVVREDKSILDFIDGKYTFLNEKLAKFYGIPGVTGNQFRRVSLNGTERSGVLTQAAVLTVTSYPTRTSPVLRGKWILENVLNAPPPPPPPGVGSLDTSGGPLAGTMRQQMEKHRQNPMCASCHMRMDPLGFALENYNAIGQWRTHDANQPIDASGVLPNGTKFQGSAGLKAVLLQDRDAFAECLTEKMMIYALGRGLEGYDRRAVKQIVSSLANNDYRFSTLVQGVVESVPFQMGRGISVNSAAAVPIQSQSSGGGN